MESRYQTIRIYPQALWLQNCPVLLEKAALLYDNTKELHVLQFKFRNLQSQIIETMRVRITFPESARSPSTVPIHYQYDNLRASINEHFGAQFPIYLPAGNAQGYQVTIQSITYADGSRWDGTAPLVPLPSADYLAQLGEFKETFIQEVHNIKQVSCINLPTELQDFWYCVCGTLNTKNATHCVSCCIPKETVFSLKDPDFLKERKKANDEEQIRIGEMREAERLRKQQEELENKRKRRKSLLQLSVVCGLLILALGIGLFARKVIYPEYRYQKALSYMEEQNYSEAMNTFQSLYDYKDSQQKSKEAKYQFASSLCENGDYDLAMTYYRELDGYKDAGDKLTDVNYQKANNLAASGSYKEALAIYQSLDGYEDSQDRITETKYLLANASMDCGDYETAYRLYSEMGDYKDIPERMDESIYQYAGVLVEQGKYDEAINQYKEVYHYKDSAHLQDVAKLHKAEKLLQDKNYEDCSFILKDLNNVIDDLEGGPEIFGECYYHLGVQMLNSGDDYNASQYFQLLMFKEDLAVKYKGFLIDILNDKIEHEEWASAAIIRDALLDYYSDPNLDETFYKVGKELYNSGQYEDAYHVFFYLRKIGYKDSSDWQYKALMADLA